MANISGLEQKYIQLKIGLAFSRLLEENKDLKIENNKNNIQDIKLNSSLGEVANDTGLRVATLSDIFSGKSNPKAVTIERILKSLGKNLNQLAGYYDNFRESDIIKFKEELEIAKKERAKNRKKKKK
jgi:transcriptional regulator with XRE-family HTH domain